MMKYLICDNGKKYKRDQWGGLFINPRRIYAFPRYMLNNGWNWALDNGAFAGFNETYFIEHLDRLIPYKSNCLFVVAPDVVGDWKETLDLYQEWYPIIKIKYQYKIAFVAQDGQSIEKLPPDFDTLFIGGTNKFKTSDNAVRLIEFARKQGKHIHIGRVNKWYRYNFFRGLQRSEEFTCDGTRIRFDRDKALKDWQVYSQWEYQIHLPLSGSDHIG